MILEASKEPNSSTSSGLISSTSSLAEQQSEIDFGNINHSLVFIFIRNDYLKHSL